MQGVSLDQLAALNREISALASAGVPLSEGLVRIAEESSSPASALSRRLAKRIESGKSLPEAMEMEGDDLPKFYRALVSAGHNSGRLSSALEGYADTVERLTEMRRVVGVASIYPILLLVTIWIFFSFANSRLLPQFDWLDIEDKLWVQAFRLPTSGAENWLLFAAVPVALISMALIVWQRSSSAIKSQSTSYWSFMNWVPGIRRIRKLSCASSFADLLRLFVEQKIPMIEALPLAAEASGVLIGTEDIQRLADEYAAGKLPRDNRTALRQFPPLVRLAFLTSRSPVELETGLERAAVNYNERAQNLSQSVTLYLPLLITGLIGGTSVAVYAILLLQPYIATLQEVVTW